MMVSTTTTDQSRLVESSTDGDQKASAAASQSDVQSYLISRYREALKTGDKSFAKSCLLSTRLFSVNDPNITNEIYVMAKSDGDISEAAKCFANIFDDLFMDAESPDSLTSEALVVANQMKEETRLLLSELKSQYLKLRSTPTIVGGHSRQAPSVSQSPLLSPRLRMSSEDRSVSRDSVLRLDNHLKSTNNCFFYQQLFDHLSLKVRKNILTHSIDNCDNPFERCRLMMLAINLFNDTVATFGSRLLDTLMNLSQPTSEKSNISGGNSEKILGAPRPLSMCLYAKSMLVLDAIPLIFSLNESQRLEFDLDELLKRTINYYSEFCLGNAANEYEFEELHEGLKKMIAARILANDMSGPAPDDNIEENLNVSLNLLLGRFLNEFSNDTVTADKLKRLRSLVADKIGHQLMSFDKMQELIMSLELENDIPENILFASNKDESTDSQTTTATPPPKSRGRPKKVQPTVIVSPDDGVRRHLQSKAKEAVFIYSSIMQHMFVNCSIYLKQTRSRILMRFDNPLATKIESEMTRSTGQRSSRAKNLANDSTGESSAKKLRMEAPSPNDSGNSEIDNSAMTEINESPLNSEHSRRMDQAIVDTLREVHKCMEFLTSSSPTFNRLFTRYLNANNSDDLKWYLKVHIDCMLVSNKFDAAIESLEKIVSNDEDELKVKQERMDTSDLATLTVSTGNTSVEVIHLRALAQLISCYIQTQNREGTFEVMADLLGKIKQSGLLTNDESYTTGNIIDEYRVLLDSSQEDRLEGFLFFDALSLIRYVVIVLMDILKCYVRHPNPSADSMIGHTIVLSQVDWPREVQIYESCISWIRENKPKSTTPQCLSSLTKFTYHEFFNYILDPNILEDFMALLNEGFTLDIKTGHRTTSPGGSGSQQQNNSSMSGSRSSGSSTRSGKAITTRGVNKTFKEDLKVALITQMKRSSCLIPLDLMAEFIQTSLVPHLCTTIK